jgi:fucose 4-O-acetylase-like acetyltransferase
MTQTAPPDTQRVPAPSAPSAEAPADRPAPRQRDGHLDNAKFVGVLLVVCGHVLAQIMPGSHFAHALYLFIYTFHMPLFIVLAGYFSRGFSFSSGKARKLITNLAVPYVIFETAFALFRWLIGVAQRPSFTLLDPYFVTWFLLALFVWRLTTPVWQQIRWPIAVAVAISLLAGTADLPEEMDLHRMLGLMPFFVLGLMLKREHLELLRRPRSRVLGALVLFGGLVTAFIVHRMTTAEWVLWRASYADIGTSNLVGIGMRSALLLCGTTLVLAFLAAVPARRMWFTRLGPVTMYTYLLHGFGTKFAESQGWLDARWLDTPYGVAAAMVACVAFGILLMTAPVRLATRWAVQPKLDWIFTAPGKYTASTRTTS